MAYLLWLRMACVNLFLVEFRKAFLFARVANVEIF